MNANEPTKNEPRPSMLAVPAPKPKLPKHLEGEPTVLMTIPRKLSLNLDDYAGLVHFEAGVQHVPESLATKYPQRDGKGNVTGLGMHWYLLQQGAALFEPPAEPKPEELAEKLKAAGYGVIPPPSNEDEEETEEIPVVKPASEKPAKAARRR